MIVMAALLALASVTTLSARPSKAVDTAFVYKPQIPLITGRDVNIAADIKIPIESKSSTLNAITIKFADDVPLKSIKQVEVYYTGTTSMLRSRTSSQALVHATNEYGGGQKIYSHPSYAVLVSRNGIISRTMELSAAQKLFVGNNNFYISVQLHSGASLTSTISMNVESVVISNKSFVVENQTPQVKQRPGVSVRTTGDDGVHSYRIPGLVTSTKGTLLGVYDIRRQNNYDLQDDVQVGLSRSVDSGQTWMPMQVIVDMSKSDPILPRSQNGAGDPSILVDPKTGSIWVMALWTHGIGGDRAWWGVHQGMTPEDQAAQVVLVKSTDDGKTWSSPINITEQIKDPSWYILLQGPGRGITMADGTLVFPFQYVDSARMPHATIVYSKDGGRNWKIGAPARSNTTEAQVVEITPGTLMLNMRDNRGGSRAVATTSDMGQNWVEHASSRSALQEPVCMASLIKVDAKDNVLGRDILLFSNPNTTKGRTHITIKASLDGGLTWNEANQLLLDEQLTWGYSCLSMIDPQTVGILYEGSTSQMTFQAVKLVDLIKEL